MASERSRVPATTAPRGAARASSSLRGTAREQAILDAVVELVGEVGYERVTVDAIAARARASKATMYRRWPGKAQIVADALRRGRDGAGVPALPDTGGLRGDLLAAVGVITHTFTGADGPSLLGLLDAVRDDAVLRELVGSQVRQRAAEVGQLIVGRAVDRGERLRSTDPRTALDVAFSHLLVTTLFEGSAPGPTAQERLVDDVLLPLLREQARPGSRPLPATGRPAPGLSGLPLVL